MKKIQDEFEKAINDTPDLYELFHRDSAVISRSSDIVIPLRHPFKSYPRFDLIPLPKPTKIKKPFQRALVARESRREFSSKKIDQFELSTLLFSSMGLRDYKNPYTSKRFHPSAGALYPIEAYILSLNTALPTGVYHYSIKTHGLEQLELCNKKNLIALFSEPWIKDAGLVICLSARFKKTITKYSDRGYRYVLIEAGHIGQNILLNATNLQLNSCPVGGIHEGKINAFLHLFPRQEGIVYAVAIGK